MTCEQLQQHLADYLAEALAEPDQAEFLRHLAGCSACRQEAESAKEMWALLGVLETKTPGPELRARFYQSLAAYQQGMHQAERHRPGLLDAMRAWWSRQPVFQVAYSLLLLAAGALGGHALSSRPGASPELAQMQQEMAGMRQMITLSLLQQQSASERLRGIGWSRQVDQSDSQVFSALLYAINHDPSVNVRLAAVDALRRFAGNAQVRQSIEDSLVRQKSPLMQITLIDLIVEMRQERSIPALRALASSASVNPEVRERAGWGLAQLRKE